MEAPGFNRATHLSIVWGVTLAVLTLMEWRSLDRDPIEQQILTPFIERKISMELKRDDPAPEIDFNSTARGEDAPQNGLQYTVEISFNGPLFLACFFGPVLVFQGIGWLAARGGRRDDTGPS